MSIAIRPYVRGQDDEIRVDLYNRAHAEDEDFVPSTVEETRRWDQSPQEPHRHRFIAASDGIPAGVAFASVDPHRTDGKGVMSGPHVPPELRRRGVGTALARAVLADLTQRGRTTAEAHERARANTNGFLASLGFRPIRRFSEMQRPLTDLPHGVGESAEAEIGVVEPTRETLEVNVAIENEAYKEHFNYRPLKLAELEFWVRVCAEEGTVTHISFARVGGKPVGYLEYGYDPKEIAHLKKNRGVLWDIGVLKPWRNRGVAKALLLAAMRHLKNDGIDEVRLYVDDTNVTGAHHLYEHLGFALAYRDLVHSLDLAVT
jgi:ribosomal protein S18 acetylase RimI-like enzyme